MGAPAVAPRRAPARRAPARKPARRKPRPNPARARPRTAAARPRTAARPSPAMAGAALIPHAAVRTAGAVRDISDSNVIVRLTAGRGWIFLLCVLLGGIVALNVVSLSINATSGRVGQAIEEYERQNSALRAELAEELSASRVEDAAAMMGLAVPDPQDVSYLDARGSDLSRLADLLGGDTFLSSDSSDFVPSDTYEPGTVSPTTGTTTAPAESSTPTPAPVTPAPVAPAPAPAGDGATGGVGL
jgi:hypothetical protein